MPLIYLDVCCLNRPFDDQSQNRIRLETEAILAIIDRCSRGEWQLVGSEVIDLEVSKILDVDRKSRVESALSLAHIKITTNFALMQRSIELRNYGFGEYDALHLACAEAAKVDVFLTTDDRLLKKASVNPPILSIAVRNPVSWFMEITSNGS